MFSLSLDILRIIEERISEKREAGAAIDPAEIAMCLLEENLAIAVSPVELVELIVRTAAAAGVPLTVAVARSSVRN